MDKIFCWCTQSLLCVNKTFYMYTKYFVCLQNLFRAYEIKINSCAPSSTDHLRITTGFAGQNPTSVPLNILHIFCVF